MPFLIPTSGKWRGTDGSLFTSAEDFREYILGISGNWAWRPQGIVLHNTAQPNLKQWDATVRGDDIRADAIQRMRNLASYYQGLGWQGGPHLFITDKLICVFNPLDMRGTHSPNFNATHWGVEMVGDFDAEPFDSGRGAAVRDLTVQALAVMCAVRGLDPHALKFHRDDPAGHQHCPGKNVQKGDVINRVLFEIAGDDFDKGHPLDGEPIPAVPRPDPFEATKRLQQALKDLGADPGIIDGDLGRQTKQAMRDLIARYGG